MRYLVLVSACFVTILDVATIAASAFDFICVFRSWHVNIVRIDNVAFAVSDVTFFGYCTGGTVNATAPNFPERPPFAALFTSVIMTIA